jgi:hypothetical protein
MGDKLKTKAVELWLRREERRIKKAQAMIANIEKFAEQLDKITKKRRKNKLKPQ